MGDLKSRRGLTGFAIISIILLAATAIACAAQTSGDVSKIIGDWTGESICTGNHPACHDEQVIYHIARTDEPGKVKLTADKLVNGKPETMYVLDFKYDAEKGTLTGEFINSRYHGVWEYTVKGDTMEGTLTLLPEKEVGRRIKVKKS